MSTTTPPAAIDEAKARRGLALLQKLSQNRRKQQTTSTSASSCSSMRYNPFSTILFERKRVGIEEIEISSKNNNEDEAINKKDLILFDVIDYTHLPSSLKLPSLLERNEAAAATVADLQAAGMGKVDNTGSYHWPAEDILAHLMIKQNKTDETEPLFDWSAKPSVLELGAGVGLAGFALALTGKPTNVFVTDGNERVAKILEMNSQRVKNAKKVPDENSTSTCSEIFASCLPWQIFNNTTTNDRSSSEISHYISAMKQCQYLVGADCLFFEAFHKDLVNLVFHFFLSEKEEKNKKVIFVAPSRGGSRERFLELLLEKTKTVKKDGEDGEKLKLISKIIDNYDEEIYKIHQKHLENAQDSGYNADRHYPQVVVITREI